jgi:hypothetical protein
MSNTPSAAHRFLSLLENTTWLGTGKVFFPTMAQTVPFGCELRFQKPQTKTKAYWLMSFLESWKEGMRGEMGMHFENGFIRPAPAVAEGQSQQLEWMIAHNFGVAESSIGKMVESTEGPHSIRVVFDSTSLGNATQATHVRRDMTLMLDEANGTPVAMRDLFFMSTVDVPEVTQHMIIDYKRQF